MSDHTQISLGRHSYVCNPQFRGSMNKVIVGNFSSIAEGCIFDCGFNHNTKFVTTFPLNKLDASLPSNIKNRGNIIIGNDVTIGENCIIMSGVEIEDGAVIGAGTTLRKSIARYAVMTETTGRYRFSDKQCDLLLEIAWWNWPDERILKNTHLLLSEDIDNFINNHI